MFKLLDERKTLFRWDLNRKIVIDDKTIKTVHFTHGGEQTTIDVDAYSLDDKWVADIPNILLQEQWDILVYGYDNEYTRYEQTFTVVNRDKPFGYVYSATEVHTWEQLNENKADKAGWQPNMMLGTDSKGNMITKENGGVGEVISVNGKKGIVELGANDIAFEDGETFQDKLNSGSLKGADGKDGNVNFATFSIEDGVLTMTTPDAYNGAKFELNEKGYLEVLI